MVGNSMSVETRRPAYSDEQKQMVREQYRYCTSRADKVSLAERVGLDSLEQLYNLANRLGVTRPHQGGDLLDAPADDIAMSPERLTLRETPGARPFTAHEDDYLQRCFGRIHLERIAYHLDRTETAAAWRALELGLRQHCKYWEAEKVCAWLGHERDWLHARGVDFFPCHDRRGQLAITLVSSSSLLRFVSDPRLRRHCPQADEHFLLMLDDLAAAVADDSVYWEPSRWISHGHICLNPWAGVSFRLFDDGSDLRMPGRELHPSDLLPERFPLLVEKPLPLI